MATTNRIHQTSPDRTYGQYCPIAAGLDLIGDRWTLLILRELSMGDRRFTDLRGDLPGHRTEPADGATPLACNPSASSLPPSLPPPAARSVYRLTEEGRRIEPVLRSVARFGSPLPRPASRATSSTPHVRCVRAAGAVAATTGTGASSPSDRIENDDARPTPSIWCSTVDGMQIEHAEGKPDVTLRVAVADLVKSRVKPAQPWSVSSPAMPRRAASSSSSSRLQNGQHDA